MNITEVRISLRDDAKLKAFASITLDNCFVVRGLKIIEGKSGTFVAMPSRRRKDGEYQDIAHPINNDARAIMERIILKAYREELETAKVTEPPDAD
ncbi:MAG: septation regulator SpoVG [Candidatus Krumholzibacteria bacterium]|nr:septation regulator SpoVG [Candidatus Krumholzibacteria bacterium]